MLLAPLSTWCQSNAAEPLRYVNPFIGTGGHGHTYPGATAPFGLIQLSPDTRLEGWDGCSGYHYSDSAIYGFSHTHLSGTGVPDYCDVLFQPFTGAAQLENHAYASPFRKSTEQAEAGYYRVTLDKHNIGVELTATERVGVHRYTFPAKNETGRVLIDLRHRDEVLDAHLEYVSDREIAGYRVSKGWAKEQHVYFVARFSRPVAAYQLLDVSQRPRVAEPAVTSRAIVGLLDFKNDGAPLVVTVAISGTGIDGARRNLEAEAPHFDFERYRGETREKWRRQLSKIEVEGGSDDQKTIFYTALYHTMVVPNIWNDVDGRYRGRDNQVHPAAGHDVYTVFSLWDTYRAADPLYTILEPRRTNDFIQTFLRQYEQGGLLPVWELAANETDCMIGNHAIPVIADAYCKGIRDYDASLALEAMVKSASQDRLGLHWYKKLGYVPSDKEPESVSKTLEYAFDDFAVAMMAREMKNNEIWLQFYPRAQNWKNLYDPKTHFLRARRNGGWHEPFDPREVNFNYTEANAWQYRFAMPQEIYTYTRLIAPRGKFYESLGAALDSLFTAPASTTGRDQADITGLIGQYAHGNEPSHHVAYLYNYALQPWKTQARVRQIMDELYRNAPDGLSGNEDCGQMSAWLVFSALGFYPTVPVEGQYTLGTPWFERATLHLDDGKTFTVRAPGASARRPYVQSVRLNGTAWTRTSIDHRHLVAGGELAFDLGAAPSAWGTRPGEQPWHWLNPKMSSITPVPFVARGERVFDGTQTIELGSAAPKDKIRYAIVPPGDTLTEKTRWKRYRGPFSIDASGRIFFRASGEYGVSQLATADFTRRSGAARVLSIANRYNNQYTAGGDQALVDGLRGAADFRTGQWQGYEGANLEVVIDLGREQPLRRVTTGFLQDENAWIFLPETVRVAVSTDGKNFEPAGELKNPVDPRTPGVVLHDFTADLDGRRARYLRVIGVNRGKCPEWHKSAGNNCWIFADEVVIE